MPPPLASERAAYRRAIGRTQAEWPLVELVARVVVDNGAFRRFAWPRAGSRRRRFVWPRPRRLAQGAAVAPATIARAAGAAIAGAKPLPMTGYKLDLLAGLVQDLLEQCSA